MIKSKTLRFAFLIVALVMLAVGAFAVSAESHAAAPKTTTPTTHVSIIRFKGGPAFGKTTLTVTHGVPVSFDNRTINAQSVMSGTTTLLTINGKTSAPYTFANAGTYTLTLKTNSAAKLTVTVQ